MKPLSFHGSLLKYMYIKTWYNALWVYPHWKAALRNFGNVLPSVPISPVSFFRRNILPSIFDHFKSYYMVDGKITQSSSKTGKGSWRLIDLYLIKIEQRLGLYIFKYLISSMLLTHIVHWDQYLVAEMDLVVDDMFLYMNPRVTCYSQLKINSCWHLQKYWYLYWHHYWVW